MATEGSRKSGGGMAFNVILKPANVAAQPRPSSPPKEKIFTQEEIKIKLLKAQERRESLEGVRLEQLAKDRVKAQEVKQKALSGSDSFSKLTQEKLDKKMTAKSEKRQAQIEAMQERLRDHLLKVEEVCKSGDKMSKELEEKIIAKLETHQENRQNQLQAIRDRLREHADHIKEVSKASESITKANEEKIVLRMENALKNREDKLKALVDRLKEHERRIEEVRKNKVLRDQTGAGIAS